MGAQTASRVFRSTDRELWIVTAADGPRRGGLVATTVAEASIVPEMPRVLVALARQHNTWELVEASGGFALHLIEEAQLEWVRRFGLHSGRDINKLQGLSWRSGASGSPILDGAAAWLDCRVENRMQTGDRTVYLAEVLQAACRDNFVPLTMHRLIEIAPSDMLDELRSRRRADAGRDADMIRAWRQQQSASGKGP